MSRCVEEIIPFVHYVYHRRRFLREAGAAERPKAAAEYEKLPADQLEVLVKDERARGAAIDEKTFKLTLSLTFALTIIGTLSAIMLSAVESPPLLVVVGLLLALVVFYALGAGFVALGAMKTLPSYGLGAYPDFEGRPDARRAFLAESLARNEKFGLARHARNETAYVALRNSFLCLFALLALYFAVQSSSAVLRARSWLAEMGSHSTRGTLPGSVTPRTPSWEE